GAPCDSEEAVRKLQDWPWEMISCPGRNSHRHDVTLRISQVGRGRRQIDRVLPMSERRAWRWNGDPFEPDGGGAGMEEDAAAFLLPYWMARYHGIVRE